MRKSSTRKAGRGTERFLKRILILGCFINFLLVITVRGSYLRLDRIHTSLPAISLVFLRSTTSRFLGNLVGDLEAHSHKIASRLTNMVGSPTKPFNHENVRRDNGVSYLPDLEALVVDSIQTQNSNTQTTHNTRTVTTSENHNVASSSPPTNPPTQLLPNPSSFNASSTTYYVAPNGNDSNPGKQLQPWRTIQKAANNMTAGDSVVVMPGNYDERVHITTSGASGAPITYQAEGTVIMKGFTILADYITIEGFDITDTDNSWSNGWGIFVQGSHCVLKSNYIYFATRGGIILFANGGDDPVTSNCVVMNNRLRRNSQLGIEVQGRNNLIEGNEIWRTIQYHPKWTNPPSYVDADGIRFFGIGHTIRKNFIHDIRLDDPENVNPHIDCFQTWGSGAGQDIIFEQNYCENLNEGMYAFMLQDANNLIIRNNIIQAYGGVNTGGGGLNRNLTIVNNVFANDLSFQSYPGGISLVNCPDTIVRNNIFYDQPSHTIHVEGNRNGQEIDYNLAYRSDGRPSDCYRIDYKCVDPAPVHHLWNVDPLLINPATGNFRLQGGSPAIDAGIALAKVTNDYDGNARPQGEGYDIGAFEYLTIGPTSTPVPSSTPLPPSPTHIPSPTSEPSPTTILPSPTQEPSPTSPPPTPTLEPSPTAIPPSSTSPPPTPTLEPSPTTMSPSTTPKPTDIPTQTPTLEPPLTATPSKTPTYTHTDTPTETPSSTPLPTDLNGDGQVDVRDTQLCVNVVLGVETDPVIVALADVNSDGQVNVLDVQEIVNVMLAI
jgi:parallel beta-helix repeat protein